MEEIAGGGECEKALMTMGAAILTGAVFGGLLGAAAGVFLGGIEMLTCDK